MAQPAVTSPSYDFRSRLLIDRYSSVLTRLPLRRQASLADPSHPDAEIWNVFRTLAQVNPARWVPDLMRLGRIRSVPAPGDLAGGVALTLWKRVKPPAERLQWLQRQALRGQVTPTVGRKRKGRVVPLSDLRAELKERARHGLPLEEPVEVDVIVKCPLSVLFVEIPSPSESPDQPAESDSSRTYLLRLVDAGLAYAEARARSQDPMGFSLLILTGDAAVEENWRRTLRALTRSESRLRKSLPHREGFEPTVLVGNLGVAGWSALQTLLARLLRESHDELEAALLDRLIRRAPSPASPSAR